MEKEAKLKEMRQLVNRYLITQCKEEGYWDGVYCSNRQMAQRFLDEFLRHYENELNVEEEEK